MAAGYYNQYPYSYYSPMQQMQMQQPQPTLNLNQQPQIQNGGFISVRNEMEARNYPVAPGNSITFKDETAPYVYTKTMGFSQLDRPIFDKYKLVKEDATEFSEQSVVNTNNSELAHMKTEIEKLWGEINALKNMEQTVIVEEKKDGGN